MTILKKEHLEAARSAYKIALDVTLCPQGPENNDAYAEDMAYYAASKAGATDDEANAIAQYLSKTLGDGNGVIRD